MDVKLERLDGGKRLDYSTLRSFRGQPPFSIRLLLGHIDWQEEEIKRLQSQLLWNHVDVELPAVDQTVEIYDIYEKHYMGYRHPNAVSDLAFIVHGEEFPMYPHKHFLYWRYPKAPIITQQSPEEAKCRQSGDCEEGNAKEK